MIGEAQARGMTVVASPTATLATLWNTDISSSIQSTKKSGVAAMPASSADSQMASVTFQAQKLCSTSGDIPKPPEVSCLQQDRVEHPQKKEKAHASPLSAPTSTIRETPPSLPPISPPPSCSSTQSYLPAVQPSTEGSQELLPQHSNGSTEYMRLKYDLIPQEIKDKYKLDTFNEDGWVYVIDLGMYGLPQAGILANKLLEKRLAKAGYYQCQHTPGLWRHVWRPITFCLVADDFASKPPGLKHAKHLQQELEKFRNAQWTGRANCSVAPNSIGIIRTEQYAPPCPTMCGVHYTSLPTQNWPDPSILPTKPHHIWLYHTRELYRRHTSFVTGQNQVHPTSGRYFSFLRSGSRPTLAAALSSIASRQSKGTEATLHATPAP
eukprot:CCRYP_010817-RA/>CCRYP_010817-RA protein AED:0.29 eAED:0.29 QI:0/-1/0/1/-1/1/1/0/379